MDKATNGALKITVHGAGSLIKHPEIKRAVRQGTAPIGEILESLASNEAPVYGIDFLPFLATGYDAAKKLYAAQKPFLEKQLASEGLILLYSVPWPPQGLYAKRDIKSVNDLKGLKFRTYNATIGRIAALAGAIPTQIEVPDLPTAFATGRVDVMITSASTGVDTKAQDYLTHYIDTAGLAAAKYRVRQQGGVRQASGSRQKQAVTAAAKAAEDRGWKASTEEKDVKTKALRDAGIKVDGADRRPQSGPVQDRRHHRHGVGDSRRRRRRRNARRRSRSKSPKVTGAPSPELRGEGDFYASFPRSRLPNGAVISRRCACCIIARPGRHRSSPAAFWTGCSGCSVQTSYGWQILSLAEIAGYLLAAASFLALAPTLKAGAHIRVTMLLSAFGEAKRRSVRTLRVRLLVAGFAPT